MSIKVAVLGCGTSSGVPMIGKIYGNYNIKNKGCNPNNPNNNRRRCAVIIESDKTRVLIDAGPDIKQQLVDYGETKFDALLITHTHADHIHGIDDLRWICERNRSPLKVYSSKKTRKDLKTRFSYALKPLNKDLPADDERQYYRPVLDVKIIQNDIINVGDLSFTVIHQKHGNKPYDINTLGFRVNNFAYCTDVVEFKPKEFDKLRGVETWLVGCLRYKKHEKHANVTQVKQWIKELGIKKTYLTHMDYTMDYDRLIKELDSNIIPAHDNLYFYVE